MQGDERQSADAIPLADTDAHSYLVDSTVDDVDAYYGQVAEHEVEIAQPLRYEP